MNFDGVQDDDTDDWHHESRKVGLSDVFEDVNVGLKLKTMPEIETFSSNILYHAIIGYRII